MRRVTVSLLAAALLVAAACGGTTDASSASSTGTARDSAGIRIVEHHLEAPHDFRDVDRRRHGGAPHRRCG